MKVIVNLPVLDEDKEELQNRIADFHATLLIQTVKKISINDKSKEKILNMILEDLKEKCTSD